MKPYTAVSVVLIGFIAIMQAVRFAMAWPVSINGYSVPVWPSAVAFVLLAFIAAMLWREGRR